MLIEGGGPGLIDRTTVPTPIAAGIAPRRYGRIRSCRVSGADIERR
jgi:hypothetical protein